MHVNDTDMHAYVTTTKQVAAKLTETETARKKFTYSGHTFPAKQEFNYEWIYFQSNQVNYYVYGTHSQQKLFHDA